MVEKSPPDAPPSYCAVRAPENFVKPPGYGSSRGDLAPSLSYEVLAKAKVIYREDYLLYERLRKMDVRARVEPPRRRPHDLHAGRGGRGSLGRVTRLGRGRGVQRPWA